MEFDSKVIQAQCVTENPRNKIKMEIDETHRLYIKNENVTKEEVKVEFTEDTIKTEEIVEDDCLSFNIDMPTCIEECILYCDQCNYRTNDKRNLTDHVFTHRFECSYTTLDNSTLITHKRNVSCNVCSFTCLGVDVLNDHMCIHKEVSMKEEPSKISEDLFECDDCLYSTNSKTALKLHVKTCSKVKCLSTQMLRKHIKCCDKCSYQTYYDHKLTEHKVMHSGEKPFECTSCDYSSHSRSYLNKHSKIHTSERKFSCDKCDYKTFSKNRLTNHEIVHSERKTFKCSLCDFSTIRSWNLKLHLKKHSGEFGTNATTKPSCENDEQNVQQVIKNVHLEKYIIMKYYAKLDYLHNLASQKDLKFKACSECKREESNEFQTLPYIVKEEIKEEFLVDSIKTEGIDEDHSFDTVCDNKQYQFKSDYDSFHQKNIDLFDKLAHVSEDLFECYCCGYKTDSKFTLKFHTRTCINGEIAQSRLLKQSEINKCDKCDYSTSKSRYLRQHLFRIHGETKTMLKCKLCNFLTYNESRLAVHEIGHTVKKVFKCSSCDYQSKYSSHLKEHTVKHSGVLPFGCDKCKYRTYSKSSLTRHKVVHSDDKPFKCVLCDFTTKRTSILKVHLQRHSGERNFSCDNCEYKTFSQSTLTIHKRIHSGKKPFKCNSCDYRSKYVSDLKVHTNIHLCERIFSCDVCDYKSYYKSNLNAHKRIHSEDKSFEINYKMNMKRKKINSKIKPFKCDSTDYDDSNIIRSAEGDLRFDKDPKVVTERKTRYKCTLISVSKLEKG
ncbi:hypothetical protein FQR65_LT15752 [Abscondita terminalis]|nr:hypothetical protein FQR65_LT15752 [Abscondita terminalis]